MATFRHWGDPLFARPYELALFQSQYLLYHVTGAGLTALVGDAELANRILLALAGAFMPLSFLALLRSLDRDPRLAVFACLPFWSRSLVIGFLPFVASIPIAFYALAHLFRMVRGRGSCTVIAILSVILFYAHVSTWMIFVVTATMIAVVARRLRGLLARVPSGVFAALWVLLGSGGSLADTGEVTRMRLGRSLLAMPLWIFDVWRGHGDELAAVAWWLGFLGAVVLSARFIARYPRRALLLLYVPFACVLVVYLAMPWRVGAALMLNVRLAPILVLFAFLPLRLPRRGRLSSVILYLGVLASVAGGVTALRECRAARAELGDLDAMLAPIPPGARLLTLTFDPRSTITHIYPWAHVGAYHRVRGGGVASFSFSELRHWPIHYAPSQRPPAKPGMWDVDPFSFDNAVDGVYYDYVLVHGGVDPFANVTDGPAFRRLAATGPWVLYAKMSPRRE